MKGEKEVRGYRKDNSWNFTYKTYITTVILYLYYFWLSMFNMKYALS